MIFALQSLPRFRSGIDFADKAPFVRTVRCRTVANTLRSDLMSECSAGKSKKASSVASGFLRQASDRLVVRGAVFVGEHVDRGRGRRTGRRAVNLAKVGFHIDLNRESDLVQHIPVALPPGRARLATRPLPIGSFAVANTMGIADVAPLTATAAEPEVTMTSTLSATNSAARSA